MLLTECAARAQRMVTIMFARAQLVIDSMSGPRIRGSSGKASGFRSKPLPELHWID
jgi:hypothetical protein